MKNALCVEPLFTNLANNCENARHSQRIWYFCV
nr:MAG TPA: hypothetical protein [Caudoviricetes sp.]